ncbi:MAG: cupin domain-containing protein [Patescibacteria group bacterium]
MLREVEKQPQWSMAHVVMNPMAVSLLHQHRKMEEIYVVTRGFGRLGLLTPHSKPTGHFEKVAAGSVHRIEPKVPHILENETAGTLEHLVFAFPPFNPKDVHLIKNKTVCGWTHELDLQEEQDCFDGAKILPYSFPDLDISMAFGRVTNDSKKRKKPHFHKRTTEWIYVVEGEGTILIGGEEGSMSHGDWFRIDPREPHAMRSDTPENLVVVCVCSPAFDMNDVYY